MLDEKRVKIRRCQVIKLILTGFIVVQENIKPSVLMHRPRKLGLYFYGIIFSVGPGRFFDVELFQRSVNKK